MPKSKKPKIALVDGTNLIFRAYFAVPHLNTSDGQSTNAIYGSLKFIKTIINDLKPDYLLVCWDSGKKTFRHDVDPRYKAHRPPVDDELKMQFNLVKDIFNRLCIPQMVAPNGAECDDLIGTLSTKVANLNYDVFIVSSDKDFYQLCDKNIKVYSLNVKKSKGNGIVDVDYIKNNYDVENPKQLVDIKSLTGEKTDNIQGVKGIGPKIATSLIKKHGNIKNLLSYLSDNPSDKYIKLLDNIDIIEMAYKLALIKTNVEILDIPFLPLSKINIDENKIQEFFEYYEMKSFLLNIYEWINLFSYAKEKVLK
jgi:DNA polymerase-1